MLSPDDIKKISALAARQADEKTALACRQQNEREELTNRHNTEREALGIGQPAPAAPNGGAPLVSKGGRARR